MLQKLIPMFALCVVLCYGTLNINVSTKLRVKRAHEEVKQSNLEDASAKENFENTFPILKNKSTSKMESSKPEAINLRLDGVTKPLSKIFSVLPMIKNTQSPVKLFLKNDQQETNDQHKQLSNKIGSSDISKVSDNYISKSFTESKPKYRKLHENIDSENINKEYNNQINKSQQNLKSNNKNTHDIVLVNKMNNHHENENLEDKKCINDTIHNIIEILEKSLNLNELRTSSPKNETQLQELLELHDDIEKLPNAHSDIMPDNNCIISEDENYDEMNSTYNETFMRDDERVIQILQEQNKLLKSILFKTFCYGNDTKNRRHENETRRINLTLNINNLGANVDDCKLNSVTRKSGLYEYLYSKESNSDFEKDVKNNKCKTTTAIRNNIDSILDECFLCKDNYISRPYFNQFIIRLPVNLLGYEYEDSNRLWSYSYNNYCWLNTTPQVNANINWRRSDNLKYIFKFIPCDYKKPDIPLPLNYHTEQIKLAPNCLETKMKAQDIYRNQLSIQNCPYYYINS